MNKIRATVSGRIQNVGYRAKVIRIAKDIGLTGFIQNLDDGRVRIIAENKNGDFGKFLDAIRIKNTLIDVVDVEVEHADATGDFADFYKLVGGGETDERLDKASDYLKKLIDVTEHGFGSLNSKVDVMIEKQNETTAEIRVLREAQNETTAEIRVLREAQNETTAEIRGLREAQNETTAEIGGLREAQNETTAEIRGLREDMKTYMDHKFGEIESELDVIKNALRAKEILC